MTSCGKKRFFTSMVLVMLATAVGVLVISQQNQTSMAGFLQWDLGFQKGALDSDGDLEFDVRRNVDEPLLMLPVSDKIEYWMKIFELHSKKGYVPEKPAKLMKIRSHPSSEKLQQHLHNLFNVQDEIMKDEQQEKQHFKTTDKPLKCQDNKKWAVITSIAAEPTKTMKTLVSQNWCVVVIGDERSPVIFPALNASMFVYLSLADQEQLPFEIVKITPKSSFSRKNIGYLYAMSHGADVILDIDDDNEPIPLEGGEMLPVEREAGTFQRPAYEGASPLTDVPVWNPYPFFNLPNAWPRGYPWGHLWIDDTNKKKEPQQRMNSSQQISVFNRTCIPIIQQYMANLDPDVDAIHRLKRPIPGDYRVNKFKRIVLPHNVFSPYNAQATIHLQKAFWSMLLPTTVDGRVADIWRSYITQSLLYLIPDACIMFTSPAVKHTRNAHNYISDFKKELPLYSTAEQFIDLVRNLPVKATNFPSTFIQTYIKLYETGLLDRSDVEYAVAWWIDLQSVGAWIPSLPGKDTRLQKMQLCIMFNSGNMASGVAEELVTKYLPLFNNVILLVDQNTHNNNKLMSEYLNVSEPLTPDFQEYALHWPRQHVSSFLCSSRNGWYQSRCLNHCLSLADRKSVIYMADDDYFDLPHLLSLPAEKIWFSEIAYWPTMGPYDNNTFKNMTWYWKRFSEMVPNILMQLPTPLKDNYLKRINETGLMAAYGRSDCIYVPSQLTQKLIEAFEEIAKISPDLFCEVAIPLAVELVSSGSTRYTFKPNLEAWGGNGKQVESVIKTMNSVIHLHAVKLSLPNVRAAWRDAISQQYIALSNNSGI